LIHRNAVVRFILLTILLVVVARMFWRVMDGILAGARNEPRRPRQEVRPGVKLVRDPVCGTYVAPGAALSLTSGGGTHYFCSEKCLAEFRRKS
jgi:YHS domain-containing protein